MNLNKFIFKYQNRLYFITIIIALILLFLKPAIEIIIAIYFIFHFGLIFIIAEEETPKFSNIYHRKMESFYNINKREPSTEEEKEILEETRKQYYEIYYTKD